MLQVTRMENHNGNNILVPDCLFDNLDANDNNNKHANKSCEVDMIIRMLSSEMNNELQNRIKEDELIEKIKLINHEIDIINDEKNKLIMCLDKILCDKNKRKFKKNFLLSLEPSNINNPYETFGLKWNYKKKIIDNYKILFSQYNNKISELSIKSKKLDIKKKELINSIYDF